MNKYFVRFMQRMKEEGIPFDDRIIMMQVYIQELYRKDDKNVI